MTTSGLSARRVLGTDSLRKKKRRDAGAISPLQMCRRSSCRVDNGDVLLAISEKAVEACRDLFGQFTSGYKYYSTRQLVGFI